MSTEREKFDAEELAVCLSHFDLGVITRIQEFPRGSGRAPKVVIESQRGKFLFKRRPKGRDDPAKVAFSHRIQLTLAAQNFPLPRLIGTREGNSSMLVCNSAIYEMFEFVDGKPYDGSLNATFSAGRTLGLYHKLLADFRSDYAPPTGSYHNANAVRHAVRDAAASLQTDARPSPDDLNSTLQCLAQVYDKSARQAVKLGLSRWAAQIAHGDWHPGNMLFRGNKVVAVIDYDAARLHQRLIDLANGALQFSIIGGGKDLARWPEYVDESRFKRFLRGYDSVNVVSVAEIKAIPYLMCEAAIAEAVLPIAATGSFGRMDGPGFLKMIERKVRWILAHLDELYAALDQ